METPKNFVPESTKEANLENLFNLIRLGLAFAVLNIDPWIALPRCFVDPMTTPGLPRFTEVIIANVA